MISTIAIDDPIEASKVNEIIDAINAIGLSSINFNGVGGVVVRSTAGNIAGASRSLAGTYRISFTTPMPTADYAVSGNCNQTQGNDSGFVVLVALTTGYFDIVCKNDDGGTNDCSIITLNVTGG